MVTVMASLSDLIRMEGLAREAVVPSDSDAAVMERKRFLSQASAALETSSRRKTSRLE
jgi:hypothetical protein